jgi:hypothetical protein
MVVAPKNPIFRSEIVQKYMQNREKSVILCIVAPSTFLLYWIILSLLIAAGIAVWSVQVPAYLGGSGIVLNATDHPRDGATAAILISPRNVSRLRTGLPVRIQIGHDGPVLERTIGTINQQPLSPAQLYQIYGLETSEPSFIATVELGPTLTEHLYAGSLVQAQIQTGTQSLLPFFSL